MITVKLIIESNKKPNLSKPQSNQRTNNHSSTSDEDNSENDEEEGRKRNNWSEDDFANLRVINLNFKQITKIDNLELFHEMQELYLKGNQISVIENLEFLFQLHTLDLSDNLIESHQLQSENFPSSLKVLILSGNPCARDSESIHNLQQRFPNLQIIVEDATNPQEDNPPQTLSSSSSLPETIPSARDDLRSLAMDSELVLREVVDRKCRLQGLVNNISIDALTKELDQEYEKVLSHTHASLSRREEKYSLSSVEVKLPTLAVLGSNPPSLALSSYESRLKELRSSHQREVTEENDFISRLRQRALDERERLYHPVTQTSALVESEEKKN